MLRRKDPPPPGLSADMRKLLVFLEEAHRFRRPAPTSKEILQGCGVTHLVLREALSLSRVEFACVYKRRGAMVRGYTLTERGRDALLTPYKHRLLSRLLPP